MKKILALTLVLSLILPLQTGWARPVKHNPVKHKESVQLPVDTTPAVIEVSSFVAPLDTSARQAFLIDTTNGTQLYAKNADAQMPTSSMSKMLTAYLVFEALKNEKIKLDDMFVTSEKAWRQEGSRMFLKVGQQARVEDLIRGLLVQSGNDAAVVLAEGLGGTESDFAEMMNAKAKDLGMENSHFKNATGLPEADHYSTARDLAVLGYALIRDFPDDYHYFSEEEFVFNGIKQGNRNPLLYRGMNVDGIKTGHSDVGGYGMTGSAKKGNRRLIVVVNGLPNMQARADETARIMEWGFREFGLYTIVKKDAKMVSAKVWLGTAGAVPLVASQDVILTLPRNVRSKIVAEANFNEPIHAPIKAGDVLGNLVITAPDMKAIDVPLVAGRDVRRVGLITQMYRKFKLLIGGHPHAAR